jgi:hypothetical protein
MTMAKRKSTRRRAKPETHEIGGHVLTQTQYELYQRKLEDRLRGIAIGTERRAMALALADVLFDARPSNHVKERVLALSERASHASVTIGSLERFIFFSGDKKLIGLGNAVIEHCAEELEAVAQELRSMHSAITQEIASDAEVAHG